MPFWVVLKQTSFLLKNCCGNFWKLVVAWHCQQKTTSFQKLCKLMCLYIFFSISELSFQCCCWLGKITEDCFLRRSCYWCRVEENWSNRKLNEVFRRWQKMVKLKGNQDIWWAGFWNQSNARIDLSQFEKLTCLERNTLLQIIHSLIKPGNFVQRIAYRCVLLAIFKKNYAPKLFTAFKAAHSYWFS